MQDEFDVESLSQTICEAVIKHDLSRLVESITRFSTFCFKGPAYAADPFPDVVFDAAINLLSTTQVHDMEGAHEFLMLFEYDWSRFSAPQKGKTAGDHSAFQWQVQRQEVLLCALRTTNRVLLQ